MSRAEMFQIGQVAQEVGLSLRTVRYYEEVGLVTPSGHTQGGFRLYTDEDVERLKLIKQMKPLDFTLDEMRDVLDLRDTLSGDGLSEDERAAATERLKMDSDTAAEACKTLRARVEAAESFARKLRREVVAGRPGGLSKTR